MPNYRYQVRTSAGQTTTGVVAADSATSAATILRNQGSQVLSISLAIGGDQHRPLLGHSLEVAVVVKLPPTDYSQPAMECEARFSDSKAIAAKDKIVPWLEKLCAMKIK